ncbi:M48 family metallopeptidase [candidate division KSB1 bacterium]
MATIYTHQDKNIRKTWFLMLTFFLVIVGVAWSFSYILQSPVILWVAVIFSVLMNVGAYWFSDKVVLKMSGAHPVSQDSHKDLWNILENLSITAGLPMPRLYIIDDKAPNAFATGRNADNAVVAVTTGLLSILDKNELEGVIAHELSHIGNRDMLVMTVVVVLLGFITLLSDFFLRMTLFGGNRDRGGDGKMQLIMIVAGLVLAILSPIIAKLIQLAISRKREFLADASGALLTRYPEGLASALEKISQQPASMKKANHATAHLFISNPFGNTTKGGQKGKFLNRLFLTHPPTEERIAALRIHS